MYKIEEHTGEAAVKALSAPAPMGAGVPAVEAQQFQRVEVWGSSFSDDDDFCEFHAYKADGKKKVFTIPGY